MNKPVLYITYDGLMEPLGQSQVLAYQERLAADREVHILSFEKSEDWHDTAGRESLAARVRRAGIIWHPRKYHKRPSALATSYDILIGILTGLWLILRHRIGIVHARSYVPSVMALVLKRLTGVSFIFDMRGFWADERVDGGLWPRDGRMYRVAKWFEKRFLLNADHVVSLTQAAVNEMKSFPYLSERFPPYSIIPTCADLDRFRATPVESRDAFILGYVGSVGTWYLFDSVLETFMMLRQRNESARMLIVNHGGHEYIRERMLVLAVPVDCVDMTSASHDQIPQLMSLMDAGIFFYKPSYSRAACAPTKLAEFLGCGIPCLSNTGVGDMAEILEGERVGVAVNGFSQDALRTGIERLLALRAENGMSERCRAVAEKHFSLDQGVRLYASVYDALESA